MVLATVRKEAERFSKNIATLNKLMTSEFSYINFIRGGFKTKHGCFGTTKTPVYPHEEWIAYVSRGEAGVNKENKIVIPEAVFYDFEGKPMKSPPLIGLSQVLSGEHLVQEPWHLFFGSRYHPSPIGDGWDSHTALYVLAGEANFKRFFGVCRKIIEEEPELVERRHYTDDKVYTTHEPNPYKARLDYIAIATKMPWPIPNELIRTLNRLGPMPLPDLKQLCDALQSFQKRRIDIVSD